MLTQKANALTTDNNLEIFMSLFYAKSAPEATAFRPDGNCFRHIPGNGYARIERNKMPRTSPRVTFTRCCNSLTLAARSFWMVRIPSNTGHAQASRTRIWPNGNVFV